MNDKKINIFTDGSCLGNPGPGGWAAILLEGQAKKPTMVLRGNESDTTNNRMEMIAVIEALRYVHEKHLQQCEINLFSDSALVINTLRLGWKRKKNLDLWEELDELNEELSVSYSWVEGHAKNRWNNECDKIAVSESTKAKKKNGRGKMRPRVRESRQSTLFQE
jgi:ribonuclease HI